MFASLPPIDEFILGDALKILPTLPTASIDAIVTDPPSGIKFMGQEWDGDKGGRDRWVSWMTQVMTEGCRTLKPGAYALVWAIPRTSHWTAWALENAGFEIRDIISHLFGSGMPKSRNIQKAIEIAQGYPSVESDAWSGFGTNLKPAVEHWILCRKPMDEAVAENCLTYGTGALNIDRCRITTCDDLTRVGLGWASAHHSGWKRPFHLTTERQVFGSTNGRYPSNLVLSHCPECHPNDAGAMACVQSCPTCGDTWRSTHRLTCDTCDRLGEWLCPVAALDEQSGVGKSRVNQVSDGRRHSSTTILKGLPGERNPDNTYSDEGGASRFFPVFHEPFVYAGKASRSDRTSNGTIKNNHPTVKSQALMRWLCKLITPYNGIILDMFAGSATTALAARSEGFHYVAIEEEATYYQIGLNRLADATLGMHRVTPPPYRQSIAPPSGQLSLFSE